MGTYSRYPGSSFGIRSYFPRGVRALLIINFGIFIFQFFFGMLAPEWYGSFLHTFGLSGAPSWPCGVFRGAIWQLFTYLFIHGDFWHILFNMLTLWMFGADLEREWGFPRFLQYYFVCGMGAGICDTVVNWILGNSNTLTIGASGAIYGILLAFGMLYPTRTVYFSFLFPIQAKYFVLIMGAIAFMSSFNRASAVSNVAHLGGMLFGYLYLRYGLHRFRITLGWKPFATYQQWRRRRAQQKFKVYMRKHDRDENRWVN